MPSTEILVLRRAAFHASDGLLQWHTSRDRLAPRWVCPDKKSGEGQDGGEREASHRPKIASSLRTAKRRAARAAVASVGFVRFRAEGADSTQRRLIAVVKAERSHGIQLQRFRSCQGGNCCVRFCRRSLRPALGWRQGRHDKPGSFRTYPLVKEEQRRPDHHQYRCDHWDRRAKISGCGRIIGQMP